MCSKMCIRDSLTEVVGQMIEVVRVSGVGKRVAQYGVVEAALVQGPG